MSLFSVIVPVLNEKDSLPKAIDALIHQSVEDFEVILVDGGSQDGSVELLREACRKYVDFFLIEGVFHSPFDAMNRGMRSAEGEYILFLSAHDFITDETIEALSTLIENSEKRPDVVVFRNYLFGNGMMPHFDPFDDQLAPLPSVPKYDNLCLRSLGLGNKCFRRAYLENRKLFFDASNPYADWLFVYQSFVFSRHTVGCPNAFCEKKVSGPTEPLSPREEPTSDNLRALLACMDTVCQIAVNMIESDSATDADGSESYIQEVYYRCISLLCERFYQKLWSMDDETYTLFLEEYNRRVAMLNREKMEKYKKLYGWLGAPYVFAARDKVQYAFSLAVSFTEDDAWEPFLSSLYRQSFPFFEVIVPRAALDAGVLPPFCLYMPNLRVLADRDFFAAARKNATAPTVLIVKEPTPLFADALKELNESKTPPFLRQSVFTRIRKTAAMRQSLKEKGLNI